MIKCLTFKNYNFSSIFLKRTVILRRVFFWVEIVIVSESQQAKDWILSSEDHIPAKQFPKEKKAQVLP